MNVDLPEPERLITGLEPVSSGTVRIGALESGVNWAVISAATLLSVASLLVAFLIFQCQFVQSFMYAGIE